MRLGMILFVEGFLLAASFALSPDRAEAADVRPTTQSAFFSRFPMIANPPDPQMMQQLASVIESEAQGQGREAMGMIGWTILERMRRNHAASVDRVWQRYAHDAVPSPQALRIAKSILDGAIPEPPGQPTHFYSPHMMPLVGHPVAGVDISGGSETIGGRTSYRPGFAAGGPDGSAQARPADDAMTADAFDRKKIVKDDDIERQYFRCQKQNDRSRFCNIMTRMYRSIRTAEHFYTPNGLVTDRGYFTTENKMMETIKTNIVSDPDNHKAYCDILVKMPANMVNHDLMSGLVSAQIALMMDSRQGHCMRRLDAAFPHGGEVDRFVEETIPWECRMHKFGDCGAVRYP